VSVVRKPKRNRSNSKTSAKSKSLASALEQRWTLFGQPQLLPGEDAATYDELLARICEVVRPVDVIEEMFINDVLALEWEVLRWRGLKAGLLQACGLKALEDFLAEKLEDYYYLYDQHFADDLAKILKDNLPEDQAEDVQTLARKCARNEPEADEKVDELLASINQDMDDILDGARARKAKELVQEYVRREPDAVTAVHELLSSAGLSIEALMVDAFAKSSTISSGSIALSPSRRAAATPSCTRLIGIGQPSAKYCAETCKRSRMASLK
jgi:hypothetical protein